jgi:hypothetical protein
MALIKITTNQPLATIYDVTVPITVAGVSATAFDLTIDVAGVPGTVEVEVASGGFGTTGALAAAARVEFTAAVEAAVADPYAVPNVESIIAIDDAYLHADTVVAIVGLT